MDSFSSDKEKPSTSKEVEAPVITNTDDREYLQETDVFASSGSEFELGDNDVHSSDSEWSNSDNVALTILKKGSKYRKDSSSDDDNDVCLAVLRQQTKQKETFDDLGDNADSVVVVKGILDDLVSSLPINLLTEDTSEQQTVTRKRKRNESEWVQRKAKALRNSGKAYTSKQGVLKEARKMRPACPLSCRNKCRDKIPEEERQLIFNSFWEIGDIDRQRDFILNCVEKTVKKQNAATQSRRSFSYQYTMRAHGAKIKVCRTFFVNTLDISPQMIETAFQKQNEVGVVSSDQRGKKMPSNKVQTERAKIVEHINTFPRVPSHYCRKNTGKDFLEGNLNKSKMYRQYQKERVASGEKPASDWVYRDEMKQSFNISFHQRLKDKCALCTTYENSTETEQEQLQERYDAHIKDKTTLCDLKDQAKLNSRKPTHASAVFDLEEVLSTPKLSVGDAYYMRKLNVYNLTIYNYGSDEVFCYLWPEHMAARGSNEISSCVLDYIRTMAERKVETITLFSDSCGGQNKNRAMMFTLWYAMNTFQLQKIEHIFFVVGHTFNEGDSAHSTIESASRKVEIYTPSKWAATIRTASHKRNFVVKEQTTEDFLDLKKCLKTSKTWTLMRIEIGSNGW